MAFQTHRVIDAYGYPVPPPPPFKGGSGRYPDITSEEISQHIQDFLNAGGKINCCDSFFDSDTGENVQPATQQERAVIGVCIATRQTIRFLSALEADRVAGFDRQEILRCCSLGDCEENEHQAYRWFFLDQHNG